MIPEQIPDREPPCRKAEGLAVRIREAAVGLSMVNIMGYDTRTMQLATLIIYSHCTRSG